MTWKAQTDCWLWDRTKATDKGYGLCYIAKRLLQAHRVAYELFVGPIPANYVIDHLCRNRSCINPSHLRTVSIADNVLADGSLSRTKINKDKTHCKWGHEFTRENTRINKRGHRQCRTCDIRRSQESKGRANGLLVMPS